MTAATPLRVVQVSFHADQQRRDAESLLSAWPMLSAVAECTAREGLDVAVVQTAHRLERVERAGVAYHFVADEGRRRARVVERVKGLQPDVVHVQGFHHGMALRQLTRALPNTPLVVQDHANAPPSGWRRPIWKMILQSIAGAMFTLREQSQPWIASGVLASSLPVFEILGGSSEFTPGDQAAAREQVGIFGDPSILWTSHLNSNKDPLMMLDAVEEAMQRLPDARLWCCFGSAPLLHVVRSRIAMSETLRGRVVLMGMRPRDQMEQLYRAADIYVQTSHHENCGFSLIEALSCGTTPVVTDIPPSRRIVGGVGALTPVGDAHAMANALVHVAGCDRAALRAAARARFEESLTFDSIGRDLRAAYEALTIGRSARS